MLLTGLLVISLGSNIYLLPPDGSALSRVADGRSPAWTCDGSLIAYQAAGANGETQIWVMDNGGDNKRQVTYEAMGAELPSWSCDGKLAYMSHGTPASPTTMMSVMDCLTCAARTVTGVGALQGMVSPDGSRMVFTRKSGGHNELFVTSLSQSWLQQLTYPIDSSMPDANAAAWSPDGSRIAFFCGFQAGSDKLNQQICVMDAFGGNRTTLTSCAGDCEGLDAPAWSPDGTAVLYGRGDRGQTVTTWIMNADGSEAHELLPFFYGGGRQPWVR